MCIGSFHSNLILTLQRLICTALCDVKLPQDLQRAHRSLGIFNRHTGTSGSSAGTRVLWVYRPCLKNLDVRSTTLDRGGSYPPIIFSPCFIPCFIAFQTSLHFFHFEKGRCSSIESTLGCWCESGRNVLSLRYNSESLGLHVFHIYTTVIGAFCQFKYFIGDFMFCSYFLPSCILLCFWHPEQFRTKNSLPITKSRESEGGRERERGR